MNPPPPPPRQVLDRGQPPPYVKVSMTRGAEIGVEIKVDNSIKSTFYKLARPTTPDQDLFLTPLTPQEKEDALNIVKTTRDEGILVGNSGWKFVWKEQHGVGWGHPIPRNGDHLTLKVPSGDNKINYYAICTYADCFSHNLATAAEIQPLCAAHKGPNNGYGLVAYEETKGALKIIRHFRYAYKYAAANEEQCRNLALTSVKGRKGREIENQHTDVEQEANKRFSIWNTGALFRHFFDPNIRLGLNTVCLANGLEERLIGELQHHGLRLQAIPFVGPLPEFPFGVVPVPGRTFTQHFDHTHGVLYICNDNQVTYAGQTKVHLARRRTTTSTDAVTEYKRENNIQHRMDRIAIAVVEKIRLENFEAEFIICNYLAYLFGFRNMFDPQFSTTTPYSLNKAVNFSKLCPESWGRIQDYMKITFGYDVQIVRI